MTDERFPRAKVRVNASGEMTLEIMQGPWRRVIIFAGGEKHSLASAVVNALANPGVEYIVSWDDEARS